MHPPDDVAAPISAARLTRLRASTGRSAGITCRASTGSAPAAAQQQALWVLDQIIGPARNAVYNVNAVLELRGEVCVAAFGRAMSAIAARHETLRTTFELVDDELVQVVSPARPVTLLVDAEPRGDGAAELVQQAASEPFDLTTGPLFRVRLYRTGPGQHLLLLAFHHIIFDGWSFRLLAAELSSAYRPGGPADAAQAPQALQYGDYAAWQRTQLASPRLGRQVAYWRNQLSGAPGLLTLPTDRPRPAHMSFAGAQLQVQLRDGLIDRLRAVARQCRASAFMVVLAAYQAVLGRWSGQDDVCVGIPVTGRSRPELEPLIGYFVNMLVVRGDLSGDPSFADLVGRTRTTLLDAFENGDVPFGRLVQHLAPRRSLRQNPLFQVTFSWEESGGDHLALEGLEVSEYPVSEPSAKCDIDLTMLEGPAGLTARFEYATDLFDASTIRRFSADFQRLLTSAAVDPWLKLPQAAEC